MATVDPKALNLMGLMDSLALVIDEHLDDPRRLQTYITAWEEAGAELLQIAEQQYLTRRARTAPWELLQPYTIIRPEDGQVLGTTQGFEGIADTLKRNPDTKFQQGTAPRSNL